MEKACKRQLEDLNLDGEMIRSSKRREFVGGD